ncbi:MAG: FMN-binding protein MioC [Oceanisphaera sp.]|uniref:FMN-binding protein MioC n=1 Tax=Oceanisphaera sp. TaxID=1929979 RepID=UPI003F9AA99E
MSHFSFFVGSTLGSAEDLAEDMADILQNRSHQTVIHTSPQVDHILIKPDHYLILVCSTHGAGDLPDNIQPLLMQLITKQPHLADLEYIAVGLGDSAYDTFCQAIQTLDQQFTHLGASRVADLLTIDVSQQDPPEAIAEKWLDHWLTHR